MTTNNEMILNGNNDLLLDQYLERNAKRDPGKTFLFHGKNTISYGELNDRCSSLAWFLHRQQIGRGDRVAILLENSVEYLISLVGTMRAGAIAVPISDQHTVCSARILFRDFEPSAVILRKKMIETLEAALDDIPSIRMMIEADGPLPFVARSGVGHTSREGISSVGRRHFRLSEIGREDASGPELQRNSSSDIAMIIYTSGTTGSPKGVVLTHGNIVCNACSIIRYLGLSDSDSAMVVLPFHYSYGNSILTTHLISGGTLVLENSFLFPNVVLEQMVKMGVTGFAGVPSTFSLLLQRSNLRALQFPRLRYVTQAGGAMSPVVADQLREALPGTDVYIMYGQTEATARLTWLDPRDLKRKSGSIGKAIPGVTITLTKEDGTEAEPGETGEIVARGGNIMSGYWNNPEESANVLRPDGLHTGDLARKDDEGYLFIVGRRSDMIKSGAHRISPKEIEEAILEMQGVGEAAVLGMPDEILGEVVYAAIVPVEGAILERKAVILHCRARLPAYKVPKKIVLVEKIPKTTSGKVRRQDLPDMVKVAQR